MDPMVGSSAATEWSDNAELLDFCFLCSRQFFHDNLDNYGTERLKDEDVLETFFEELGPVDRALLQCCPSCQALCRTLCKTKEALSSLIDEIRNLLLQSRKVSYLLSKSRIVNRLFQSSNLSLPPCEVSTSYFPHFPKDIASSSGVNNCFPSQFNLKLDSSNFSVDDLTIGSHSNASSIIKKPSFPFKSRAKINKTESNQTIASTKTTFTGAFNHSIMDSVCDNACDISENGKLEKKNVSVVRDELKSPSKHQKDKTHDNHVRKQICSGFESPTLETKEGSLQITNSGKPNDESGSTTRKTTEPIKSLKENASTPEESVTPKDVCRTKNCSKEMSPHVTDPEKVSITIQENRDNPETKYKCDICNKSLKNGRNLRNHISYHKEEKPFICEICGVSYRHKVGLDSHVLTHKGETKFKCDICLKSFSQNIGLQRHMRIHLSKYQFKCDECGKEFIHHSSFQSHKLVHQGNKPFPCLTCDMRFSQKSHLQRHERIHTGAKSHSCSICSRTFSEKYNLMAHVKCHYNETKNDYKCSKCSKSYTRKLKLKQHMNQIHGIDMS